MGKKWPKMPLFNLIFIGLSWPWIGEFIGFNNIIYFWCLFSNRTECGKSQISYWYSVRKGGWVEENHKKIVLASAVGLSTTAAGVVVPSARLPPQLYSRSCPREAEDERVRLPFLLLLLVVAV